MRICGLGLLAFAAWVAGVGAAHAGGRATLTGRVVGPDGPIAGARVDGHGASGPFSETKTAEDGRFGLHLESGEWRLTVLADALPRVVTYVSAPGDYEICIPRPVTLSGRFVDSEGRPALAGVRFSVLRHVPLPRMEFVGHGAIDDGGRFRISPVTPGEYEVWFSFGTGRLVEFGPIHAGGAEPTVVWKPVARLLGELHVPPGGPAPTRATLVFRGDPVIASMSIGPVPIDAQGRFALDCPAEAYSFDVECQPYGRFWCHGLLRALDGDIHMHLPEEPGGTILGTVVDPSGTPMAGERVALWVGIDATGPVATSDADGRFGFLGVKPGEYSPGGSFLHPRRGETVVVKGDEIIDDLIIYRER